MCQVAGNNSGVSDQLLDGETLGEDENRHVHPHHPSLQSNTYTLEAIRPSRTERGGPIG